MIHDCCHTIKSTRWQIHYKYIHYTSITNTLQIHPLQIPLHPQDQRARVARSAHEVDPLQPELRPACANTTRVETPRIAVWDIWSNSFGNNIRVLLSEKWRFFHIWLIIFKCIGMQTKIYFQMHWHAHINLFFRDSFGHLRMIINDDHYLQRVEVFSPKKHFSLQFKASV